MTVCLVTAECTHHYVWLQRTVCTCMSGYGSLYAPVCLVTEDDEVALPADQEDLQRHAAQLITPLRHGVYILYG